MPSSPLDQHDAQPGNRTIFTSDNLPVLRGIDSETIDLIYLDPPFNKGRQWVAPIGSDAEGASFDDIWTWDNLAEQQHEGFNSSVKRQWLDALHIESPIRSVVQAADDASNEPMGAYLAYMAMRIVEMHRVLKPTGGIYLHCDDTAGHYLKLLMDAIFSPRQFRNAIVWERSRTRGGGRHAAKTLRSNADTIFFYSKTREHSIEVPRTPNPDKKFPHEDERGRYYLMRCTASRTQHGGNPRYDFLGFPCPQNGWLLTKDKMGELLNENRLHFAKTGTPYRKVYDFDYQGDRVGSVWIDIPPVSKPMYPTEKPIALLERIIRASSSPGDIVLDPFCGCATACVAAEKLGRRWIGIDVSELAADLCVKRIREMQNETGQTNFGIPYYPPIHRWTPPVLSDVPDDDRPITEPRVTVRERLYREQMGICNGCERVIPEELSDLMDLDHIVPRAKGGQHVWSNVQLLCRTCNVRKGSGTMAQLKRKLREEVA